MVNESKLTYHFTHIRLEKTQKPEVVMKIQGDTNSYYTTYGSV